MKVVSCGVCHTDLHIVEGELPVHKSPVVPGHQIVGTIDMIGSGVSGVKHGDRVGMPWLHRTCGTCRFCRAGKENLCLHAQFTGYDVDGGYGQYVIAQADFLCPLPDKSPGIQAAPLLCAGIIAFRALRQSGVQPGQRLGLYGFGASAHIAIQVARHWGCTVYVFTRSLQHREAARKLGADWVGGAEDTPPRKIGAAIDFTPSGRLVPLALEVLERGGTLTLAGIYKDSLPVLNYSKHLYWEKKVISISNATRGDAGDFMRIAADIPVQVNAEVFRLEDGNSALLAVKQGKINGAAVLVIG